MTDPTTQLIEVAKTRAWRLAHPSLPGDLSLELEHHVSVAADVLRRGHGTPLELGVIHWAQVALRIVRDHSPGVWLVDGLSDILDLLDAADCLCATIPPPRPRSAWPASITWVDP